MIRYFIAALALLAPFFFPWQFAGLVAVVAAFFLPPIAVIAGALIDLLYLYEGGAGAAGAGIPYFFIAGIIVAAIAAYVQHFVKTRIMS